MAIDNSSYQHVFASVLTDAEQRLSSVQQQPDVLNQYLESWANCAEKAAELDNFALQDIILLFVDASRSAFNQTSDADNLTDAQWQLLKKWNASFASYINAPDNQNLALALIQCLNDPVLATALEPEDELMLLDSFLPVIKQLKSDNAQDDILPDEVEKPISVWEKLTIAFAEAELNLQATLNNVAESSYPESLKQYLESWSVIANIIDAENDPAAAKLLDIVLLFIDFSSQLFNQADSLNGEQQELLGNWHDLFGRYIETPDSQQLGTDLVKCLCNSAWLQPISSDDENMLLVELSATDLPVSEFSHADTESQIPLVPAGQQLELLFNKTLSNLETVVKDFAEHDETALKQSLQQYLESWLAVAQQIEIKGDRLAFLDVVLLFLEVTRQAFIEPKSFNEQQLALLSKWQSLFAAYLEAPDNQNLVASLIKCLSNPVWPGAIMAEDEEMLLAAFNVNSNLQPELMPEVIDGNENFDISEESSEIVLTEEPDLELDFFDEEDLDVSEESPEVADSIWLTLEPIFNQAAAFLKAAVDSEIINDNPAFKQNLQDYIECWHGIADSIATEDSLPGLSDVVALFTEISKNTLSQLDSLSSEHFALLNTWQTSFAAYLNTQSNAQFGFRLVKCLSNPLWSEPIEAGDEPLLLAELGIDEDYQAPPPENEPDLDINIAVKAEKNPLWQKIEVFFDDTQSQIQTMQDLLASNDNQTCLEYLQQFAERWLVIAEIIVEEDERLQTLADLILLFADNCTEFVEQNIALDLQYVQLLQDWQAAFITYLQDVTAMEAGKCLCECLENAHWLHPLTSDDKGMLLELMTAESQQQSMFADESEDLFLFHDDFEAEDDDNEFALFADESDDEEFEDSAAAEELTLAAESDDVAMFADQPLQANETENLALLTEEIKDNSEELFRFADEDESSDADSHAAIMEEAVDFSEDSTVAAEKPEQPSAKPTPPVNPELIGMVRDEFSLLVNELNEEQMQQVDVSAFKLILKNHEFKFENLTRACNTIGLSGLEQVFAQLSLNTRSRRDTDTFTETEAELFKATLPLIQDYIAAVTDRDKAVALVAHLSLPGWKRPLTEDQIKSILSLLSGLAIGSHNQQLDNRKTVAEPADVSLEVSGDVNRELLDSLLNELPVLTGKFSTVIQQIISGNGTVQQLLEAQRIAHTLKGSGNIVGVAGIAVVTHHLEEILEYLTEHKIFPTKALAAVLLESADCLEMMSDIMLNGEKQPPDQALYVLQNVLLWANQIAAAGLPAEDADIGITTLPTLPDTDLTPVVQETKATEAIAMTRVPSEVIDELLRMTGEGSILSEQFKERIKRFSAELKALNDLTWQMQSLVAELDQSINIQSYTAKTGRSGADAGFDALEMEQYNELHTAASRISEVATDIREINIHMDEQLVDLKYLMIEEDSIQKENQEIVQSIRMVPANTIISRCQRIVRQACRATSKEVDLEIKGADILIDSEILNDMVDPLMHLLRNSIDHGIEPVHIREKFNKPKTGKITLEFSRKGNYAVISCKDDGGGLASGNILQTAIKKGLVSAQQKLTDAEIHKLILIPGFSTRAVVTQTSGRGIGMDAIQTKISSIQGQMNLHSVRGEGLTIEITIPLTLSSMLSLLVKCGGQTMAISNRGLRKIHHSDECTLVETDGQLFCEIEYKRYPAKYFAQLVGMPFTYSPEQKLQALRIEDEIGRTHIVFVEELLGYRDLLVKNMGAYIPHIQGITGASILGNGDVAPVIDLVEMLHHAAKYDYVLADATKALADSINGLPVALVIDDSLSARRSVAMLLKDSGLEVETAIDGLDAIKHIDKSIPDIILVDLEMPRMNGIELTAHVRGREDMKDTPIIMITSRATEKHRKQAEAAGVTKFMTKPFTEDELINSVRMLMK